MNENNRKKASAAVLVEIGRLEFLTELLAMNIEGMKNRAERGESTWGHHGDAAHVVEKLAELLAKDGEAKPLIAEIDAERAACTQDPEVAA